MIPVVTIFPMIPAVAVSLCLTLSFGTLPGKSLCWNSFPTVSTKTAFQEILQKAFTKLFFSVPQKAFPA